MTIPGTLNAIDCVDSACPRLQLLGILLMARVGVDVKDLQYFLAVYELQGFSKAAERLRTVQSNVSARIRALERHLGLALFERRYRRVIPTRGGDKLYNTAKRLLAAFHSLERKARTWRRLSYSKNR